jgi:hypothetical protein
MVAMVLTAVVGRKLGLRRKSSDEAGYKSGNAAAQGAIFALLGLLIAFTFSKADERFDHRRSLITEEANAIGSAYLYLDLLQPSARDSVRDLFRQYLDARLATFRDIADEDAEKGELIRTEKLQNEIWLQTIAACDQQPSARMQLLPSVNDMFNIATTRSMAAQTHSPVAIYIMLALMAVAAALLAGYETAESRFMPWVHLLCFSCAISITFYVIIDLEFPRFGFIRLNGTDLVLTDLRKSMN